MYDVWTIHVVSSILIGSSSFLLVTRTAKKSWMGLKFRKFGSGTAELAALEHLEKIPLLIMGEMF